MAVKSRVIAAITGAIATYIQIEQQSSPETYKVNPVIKAAVSNTLALKDFK